MSTGSGRTHSGSRLIQAPPERIYRAFVEAGAVAAWRPPAGMTMRIHAFDPRPGGEFRMTLHYEGPHHPPGKSSDDSDIVRGRFGELMPDRMVVELVEFESDDPDFSGTMIVTTTLAAAGGGTLVTIRCDDVPEGISESDHAAGIASSLEKLALYTE